jgi:hypothetical protein
MNVQPGSFIASFALLGLVIGRVHGSVGLFYG